MDKFGRRYELTIYPVQYLQTSPSKFGDVFSFITTGNAEIIKITNPFTLIFNIRRKALSSSNTASFKIYNLNENTRNQLYKDYTNLLALRHMTLRAGYSDPLPIIFDGNIKWCTSSRGQGETNFITEIEAFDWTFPVVNSHTSRSFPGEVRKQQVVDQLVKDITSMGPEKHRVTRGHIRQYVDENNNPIVEYDRVLSGYSWHLLKEETDNACFIDNGQLHILNEDDYFDGSLTEISSETGLLGAPKRSETFVMAEMVFEPTLVVGQQVTLKTSSQKMFNGQYKIIGINHMGVISDAVSGKCQTMVSLFNYKKNAELVGQIPSLV